MKNIRERTLEQLENDSWPQPDDTYTGLMKRVHLIRKKKLNELSVSDLRTMVTQQFSLELIMPLIIDLLKNEIVAGDLYQGDLLKNTLEVKKEFWQAHKQYWEAIRDLYNQHRATLESSDEFRSIRNNFEIFEEIHS